MQCLVSMLQHMSFAPRHWLLRIASIWASLGDIDRSVTETVALGSAVKQCAILPSRNNWTPHGYYLVVM